MLCTTTWLSWLVLSPLAHGWNGTASRNAGVNVSQACMYLPLSIPPKYPASVVVTAVASGSVLTAPMPIVIPFMATCVGGGGGAGGGDGDGDGDEEGDGLADVAGALVGEMAARLLGLAG